VTFGDIPWWVFAGPLDAVGTLAVKGIRRPDEGSCGAGLPRRSQSMAAAHLGAACAQGLGVRSRPRAGLNRRQQLGVCCRVDASCLPVSRECSSIEIFRPDRFDQSQERVPSFRELAISVPQPSSVPKLTKAAGEKLGVASHVGSHAGRRRHRDKCLILLEATPGIEPG
jgi:hypothetical protein